MPYRNITTSFALLYRAQHGIKKFPRMILFSTNNALHLETSAYQDNRVQPPTHYYTAHSRSQLPTHSMWRLSTSPEDQTFKLATFTTVSEPGATCIASYRPFISEAECKQR